MSKIDNEQILLIAAIAATFLLIFVIGRQLYRRSLRIRNRLQMSYIFTSITHELLTPLTIISASVERMREELQKAEGMRGLEGTAGGMQQGQGSASGGLQGLENSADNDFYLMELNIQRMQRLLQQILETSKSQTGELRLLVSHGDVMQYIKETAFTIEPLMARKDTTFTISCKPESMMGWIDTDKLDKIIFNLLSNAAKYTGRAGHVALEVTTNHRYDRIIIRVSDDGNGIPKEHMRRLYSRFHDGEYRKSQTFGTGIGLSLTRDLVHLHRGTIRCESHEGRGTQFTIELPINKESFDKTQIDEQNSIQFVPSKNSILDMRQHSQDVQPLEPKESTAPPDAYRILIAEDNAELLMLMKQLLQHRYHVVTASNGREALDLLHTHYIDLVVSDVMMPEMDGYELTISIKNNPELSHLPIILLTARTQEEDRKEALLAGADGYLSKPFRMGDLQLSIDNLVANRQRIMPAKADADSRPSEPSDGLSPMEREFLQRCVQCVKEHIDDSDYDRDTFASDMGASASTLYNKLRALTGMNVTAFIRHQRINTACSIAKSNPDLRVSDIAYRVGFKDPKYFATTFKKVTGEQPKEYLRKIKERQ